MVTLCDLEDQTECIEMPYANLERTDLGSGPLEALLQRLDSFPECATVLSLIRFSNDLQGVIIDLETAAPQRPVYPIHSRERLLIAFAGDAHPIVAPLRVGFPLLKHMYPLPSDSPIPAAFAICIDDRPWEDARGNYSAAALLRRVLGWFQRAGEGCMDDDLQVPEPAFYPSPLTVILPSARPNNLVPKDGETRLEPFFVTGNVEDRVLVARWPEDAQPAGEGEEWLEYLAVFLPMKTRHDGIMMSLPRTLGALHASWGEDGALYGTLREHLNDRRRGLGGEALQSFYRSRLLLGFVITDDVRGTQPLAFFLEGQTLGDLCELLGLVFRASESNTEAPIFHQAIGQRIDTAGLQNLDLIPTNLMVPFSGAYARRLLEADPVANHVLAFGVGAIGSNIVEMLGREGGWAKLTLIDDDVLLPHNLARHTLTSPAIGRPKVDAVAERVRSFAPDTTVTPLAEKVDGGVTSPELLEAAADAELILDLTASVGASRRILDLDTPARRACAFFNPAGDSVSVLIEDHEKNTDIGILEALYLGMVATDEGLESLLVTPDIRSALSGACRDTTSRIPASRAALLSASAVETLKSGLSQPGPLVHVARLDNDGGLRPHMFMPEVGFRSAEEAGWIVRLPNAVFRDMDRLRATHAPSETGGCLMGIVDHARRRIEIGAILPGPPDSVRSTTGFERGVEGLATLVEAIEKRTLGELTYVGEWHTHPPGASSSASNLDRATLADLAQDRRDEERPAVMIIVGGDESFTIEVEVSG